MSEHILIVERLEDWPPRFPQLPLVVAKDYLSGGEYPPKRRLRILNLCRRWRYGSLGYYCSLLAEARGHRVVPGVRTIQDLSRHSLYSLVARELEGSVDAAIDAQGLPRDTDRIKLDIYLGRSSLPELEALARRIFEEFRAPMLRVELRRKGGWHIKEIKSLALDALDTAGQDAFLAALKAYLSAPWRRPQPRRRYRHDLAILHDPQEKMPPSDPDALAKFIEAAHAQGIDAELIGKRDFARLAEYDALFIRVTTAINHHSYRFARRAQSEGLVVVDDPDSILRCTNKVYLEERLRANRVPTPKTLILRRGQQQEALDALGLPVILKIPDGSFSRGVYKAESAEALERTARRLFKSTDLILAQEYLYTPFDWRVGILGGEPLFVCKYMMTKGHWQIYDHTGGATAASGDFETLAVEDAPAAVVETALKAARLVGGGLYGVDLKETAGGQVVVIEVNDNPSIDSEVEDLVLGEALYRRIMGWFRRQLDAIGT